MTSKAHCEELRSEGMIGKHVSIYRHRIDTCLVYEHFVKHFAPAFYGSVKCNVKCLKNASLINHNEEGKQFKSTDVILSRGSNVRPPC